MNQKIITEIGKSQRLRIINKLKRTRGLSVKELAPQLGMSYMGVKQHCIDLQKDGYLDTWRRPKPQGRPEMVYRLTLRAHDLFPVTSNAFTTQLLDSAQTLYGPAAAEKLILMVYREKAARYEPEVKGETVLDRAQCLVRLRDAEGCMAEIETDNGLRILEYHSPILDLLRAFPLIERLEAELFQRLLKEPVRREESSVSGLSCCAFHIGTPGVWGPVCR